MSEQKNLQTTTENIKRNDQLREAQKQIQESIDKKYYTIKQCFDENDLNDKTVLQTIQQIAMEYEEYFRLSTESPDYQISRILEYIIKNFRVRGFSEAKCRYVYEALDPPQFQKYKRLLDLSSSQSLSSLKERREDSSIRYSLFKKHLQEAKKLVIDIGSLERDKHQDAMDDILDLEDDYKKELDKHEIPIARLSNQDPYDPPDDKSKKPITYPETIPAETELSQELELYSQDWHKVAEIVKEEGIIKKGTGEQMISDEDIRKIAEAFRTVRQLLFPVKDRKWRMDHLHWFKIIGVADTWFKHTGSTASKVQDFYGRWRQVTREHVGARKENMKPFFDKYVEMTPHYYLFFVLWMAKIRIRQGAEFSGNLGPKLSESSMR